MPLDAGAQAMQAAFCLVSSLQLWGAVAEPTQTGIPESYKVASGAFSKFYVAYGHHAQGPGRGAHRVEMPARVQLHRGGALGATPRGARAQCKMGGVRKGTRRVYDLRACISTPPEPKVSLIILLVDSMFYSWQMQIRKSDFM